VFDFVVLVAGGWVADRGLKAYCNNESRWLVSAANGVQPAARR
jgi:hypothetical protein